MGCLVLVQMINTFIVTSCINNTPGRGVFSHEDRYNQTLETFESIRKYAPGSKIALVDSSVSPLCDDWKAVLTWLLCSKEHQCDLKDYKHLVKNIDDILTSQTN